jgi:parallel beta-helix repeat protein
VLHINKTVAILLSSLLLACVLGELPKAEKVRAQEGFLVIYIRPDGSVDPPTPLIEHNGETYTFTSNVNGNITVQRNNIIIDGNDYVLRGSGRGNGFGLYHTQNVTIRKTDITQFDYGILISNSSDNIVNENKIANNTWAGISLWRTNATTIADNNVSNNVRDGISVGYRSFYNVIDSNNISENAWAGISIGYENTMGNVITGNNIANNTWVGVYIDNAEDNILYHNNIKHNTDQVNLVLTTNLWDHGHLSGGNYWSDYTGSDLNGDGIGDTPYIIDANNQDNYPFMNPWTPQAYDVAITDVEPSRTYVGQGYDVRINVTVTNQGSYTQTFNITAYANQTRIETKTIALASQSSQVLTFTWNTAGATKSFYTLNATADQMPGEVDTLDNTHQNGNIKVTIAGDVNGDTIVNVRDLFLIGKAYGSTQPRPNWNSNCDINEDSTISQPDLEIVSENYAHT